MRSPTNNPALSKLDTTETISETIDATETETINQSF